MEKLKKVLALPLGILVWLTFGTVLLSSCAESPTEKEGKASDNSSLTEQTSPDSDSTVSSQSPEEQVEQARQDAEDTAESLLDQDAIAAVEETQAAIEAIDANDSEAAIAALERATGKLNILLAREPELALIPVESSVTIIDIAPRDKSAIKETRDRIRSAVNDGEYAVARELLANLVSEVRTTTVNLPLATYPEAMKEAARLLDEGDSAAAKEVLETALSTLVITEQIQPIPIINAQAKILEAREIQESDKDKALSLLDEARQDLQLAEELGYTDEDEATYRDLEKAISDVEDALEEDADTTSVFEKLNQKVDGFLKRLSK